MPMTLVLKRPTQSPIDGEALRPDALAGLSAEAIAAMPIFVGKTRVEIGDVFFASGDLADGSLVLEGDLRSVHRIGREMASGSLTIRGDVGAGLGQGMLGGSVEVFGSAGDSAGMGLRGGMMRIHGSAGDNLGGSEPGARLGMRDGVILVDGDIGRDAGLSMRRGLIAVLGNCGDGLGRALVAGSIFAFGAVGGGLGLGMKRGSLALFGGETTIGPGFAPSGLDRPTFLTITLKRLREWGLAVPDAAFAGPLSRYNGDRAERGQGEILVAEPL